MRRRAGLGKNDAEEKASTGKQSVGVGLNILKSNLQNTSWVN
jgi:hypothetical protein